MTWRAIALRHYIRDVYQTDGMKGSVNMWHIKTHYFTSHPVLNPYAIVLVVRAAANCPKYPFLHI